MSSNNFSDGYGNANIAGQSTNNIQKKTQYIYDLIKTYKYNDAIGVLLSELQRYQNSRAILSLLAYCYYHSQNFIQAANHYEQLVRLYPMIEAYKLYQAQCLLKSGLYPESNRTVAYIKQSQFEQTLLKIRISLKYEQDELTDCSSLLDQRIQKDADTLIGWGCVHLKNEDYETAKSFFTDAMNQYGYFAPYVYNIALCHYKLGEYDAAVRHISNIIERGVREHPELSVGSRTEELNIKSVGNSSILEGTQLIQAFNLKSAIEYKLSNMESARSSLMDMPPRSETELDPITLHNEALMHETDDFANSFQKLKYLLYHPPFPPETFANILNLCIRYEMRDEAADILAENSHLHKLLSHEVYEYFEAGIITGIDPPQGYQRFDLLSNKHIDKLRRVTKNIQDARIARDHNKIKKTLNEYEMSLEAYVPVLMSMAKIYWNRKNWEKVEKIFRESAEFCADHDIWKLNVAHVFFMQPNKFKEALRYYVQIVKKKGVETVLDVKAIILANLCVSYIMTSQNEDAEDLMRQIEKEEGHVWNSEKQCLHLCIVNLVIGTLYCSKGNYEFGLQRIMKSLEPYNEKLDSDTWYYTKRCFLAHLEGVAKGMLVAKDDTIIEILKFLSNICQAGRNVPVIQSDTKSDQSKNNVAYESRIIHYMYLKMREY